MPTLRDIFDYAARHLCLQSYLDDPGDGRDRGMIPASALLSSLLAGRFLRDSSYLAIERLVGAKVLSEMGMDKSFSDDTLSYLTDRLDPAVTRNALALVVKRAKRMKSFDEARWIGLAIDGTSAGNSKHNKCELCHPVKDANGKVHGHLHKMTAISVVGADLTLPFDVEPYEPGDSEYNAGIRLLGRSVKALGKRFAQYVVVDAKFATAPFLHAADKLGIGVVARLKDNLPTLLLSAGQKFTTQAFTMSIDEGKDRVEIWDYEKFPPWESLDWRSVRVLRYRQYKPDGTMIEAYWLTNIPAQKVGSRALYHMAKSRWEIENQCFNDAKSRYGLEHICHHSANSILINWLLTFLVMIIERLFRLRYLHRSNHPLLSAKDLCLLFWLSLHNRKKSPKAPIRDTS